MSAKYLAQLLDSIAKSEGFVEYEIESKAGSSHGDNFLGDLKTAKIIGRKSGSKEKTEFHLLYKSPPDSVVRQTVFDSLTVFKREIYIYSTVLPTFAKFQKEKGLSVEDSFVSYPKVFASEADEVNDRYILIMEDLRPRDFGMFNIRGERNRLDHTMYVMRELGKFHAVSFALQDQRPREFEEFKKLDDNYGKMLIDGKLNVYLQQALDRMLGVLKDPKHIKLIEDFSRRRAAVYNQLMRGPLDKNELAVITHGDCWSNNFLFKYGDAEKTYIEEMCIVDWQITRYSPPVFDVLYYIFTQTDKLFRDQHYERLLKMYHTTMSNTIRKLGSNPDKLYTYENMERQLRKYGGGFLLLTAPIIIQLLSVGDPNEINDADQWAEDLYHDKDSDLFKPFGETTRAKYSGEINNLMIDLVHYGYLRVK